MLGGILEPVDGGGGFGVVETVGSVVGEGEVSALTDHEVGGHVGVGLSAGIGDGRPGIAELVSQDADKRIGGTGIGRADTIVGGHYASRGGHGLGLQFLDVLAVFIGGVVLDLHLGFLDVEFPRLDVDFTEGLLVDPGAIAVLLSVGLLIVEGVVLHEGDQTLLGSAAGLMGSHLAGEERIFGIVLVVTAAESGTMGVGTIAIETRDEGSLAIVVVGVGMGFLAEGMAEFVGEIDIEGGGDHRGTAVPLVDVSDRQGVGIVAVRRVGIIGDGDAVLFVGDFLPSAVGEHLDHLVDGELVDVVVPHRIVEVDAAHLGEVIGGLVHVDFRHLLDGVVLLVPDIVDSDLLESSLVGQFEVLAGRGGREGGLEVGSGEVMDETVAGAALVVGLELVVELVVFLVHGFGLVGLSLAVGIIAEDDLVRKRRAPEMLALFGRGFLVDLGPGVGVLGEVEVVGAGIEDIALLVLIVVAGEVVLVDVDGDRLGLVGFEGLLGLGESAKDDVGLLDLSLLIGDVDEDLGDALSGDGAVREAEFFLNEAARWKKTLEGASGAAPRPADSPFSQFGTDWFAPGLKF